jgi:hypothetical protein
MRLCQNLGIPANARFTPGLKKGDTMLKIVAAILFFFISAGPAVAGSWTWIPVQTIEVDWNGDGKQDRIILEAAKEIVETHDPGDFHRVRIQIAGRPEFVLEDTEGWVRYRDNTGALENSLNCLKDKVAEIFKYKATSLNRYKSIVKSDYIALTPVSPRRSKEFVLLLFGYQYASSPGKLHVISLDQKGDPKVILEKEFEVSYLEDLDDDDRVELIGEPWYGEVFGPDDIFHSYVPTHIYSLIRKDSALQLQLSEALSKKYNEENYYGWVSPEAAREYIVVEPKDGSSPKLMKLTDAEKAYGKPSAK